MLRMHERTCTGGVHQVYPGGVYHSTPSAFERLDDENIRVAESLRYYPYRATLTASVGSTRNNFRRIVTRSTGWRVTFH